MAETPNFSYAKKFLSTLNERPKRVLIIGCGNRGEDVKAFNDILDGAVEIHGVDILDDTGVGYSAPNVTYIQADATKLPIRSRTYDLAYSYATFEHIVGLAESWQSMLNVLKPGGILHTFAAPLWMSPYGHHKKPIFDGHPWVHVRYPTPVDLMKWCESVGIESRDKTHLRHHVNYMLDPRFFNQHPASAYPLAVASLKGGIIIKEQMDCLPDSALYGHEDLLERHDKKDLLSINHQLTMRAEGGAPVKVSQVETAPTAAKEAVGGNKFKPCYVWPAKTFPFRLYYESEKIRIFIIENLQHNFEWLSRYGGKFKKTDRFVVVIGGHYHEWLVDEANRMFAALNLRKEQFYILFNDSRDETVFRKYGFAGDIINHNAWLDENLVMKPLGIAKKFDAIYVGRLIPVKRHELAASVPNLALVAGLSHGAKSISFIPPHIYRNESPLSPEDVCVKINEAHCGLMLSKAEGASFASSEYLRCGIPVGSTKSEGGRDGWYTGCNSRVGEDTP